MLGDVDLSRLSDESAAIVRDLTDLTRRWKARELSESEVAWIHDQVAEGVEGVRVKKRIRRVKKLDTDRLEVAWR